MKIIVRVLMCVGLIAGVAGCVSGVKPSNPQQAVIELEATMRDAEAIAVAYDTLPSCTNKTTVVCSDTKIAIQLKNAKDVAQTAVFSAEQAVRDPNFQSGGISSIVVAAQTAVAALTAITSLEAVQAAVKGAKKPWFN